ncbi:DUF3304 domain-containing protein [Archangium lipolyticum]|uniref:DUF3304 domain-containing protein n=1 Tax=Archangium lipolyticum TaxID=2970465 RepID=UPI002149E491|nr:DUF3304 domain-containing protein [Archangium lipolyticum]
MNHSASIHRARRLPRGVRWGLLLCVLPLLAGCNKKTETTPDEPPTRAAEPAPRREPLLLEINGFNYTDLYIDSFEVNGQGGGNLFVSSPESGGGGGVCCVSWSPEGTTPVRLKITWTRDRKRWCEKEVLLTGPAPSNPRHLGVHFFPDGHIEAEVTEDYPDLKLRMERVDTARRKPSGNTVADEQTARCQNEE